MSENSGPEFETTARSLQISREIRDHLTECRVERRSPDLEWLRTQVDQFHVESFTGALSPSCSRGCASCCEQMVFGVHASEIEDLGTRLRRAGEADRIAGALRARVSAYESTRRQMTRDAGESEDDFAERVALAFWAKRKPCVFLKSDHSCGIHEHRPMACRTYFVLGSPDLCHAHSAKDAQRRGLVLEPLKEFDELMRQLDEVARFDPETEAFDLALLRWLGCRTDESSI